MIKTRPRGGFTLVEVIVSTVIMAIVGMTAGLSTSVLTRANETNRNKVIAVNLLRQSLEEVRRAARTNYDNLGLGTCTFVPANTCGFEDIAVSFSGFTRTLTVTSNGTTNEFKNVAVHVTWLEWGQTREMDSLIFLSRPAKPLPGNLKGQVTDAATGINIGGVSIIARRVASSATLPATSSAADIAPGVNYNFHDAAGQFQMEEGEWHLTATRAGYQDYVHPDPVIINANPETVVNFTMEANPVNATISAQLVDNSGATLSYALQGMKGLYQNGVLVAQSPASNAGVYTFPDITFLNNTPRCFTVATTNMYQNGFAGNFSCAPGPGMTQEPRGWSSAFVQANGSLTCGTPWAGTAGADRICVSPGDNRLVNVNVVPVATATVTGTVRNQSLATIANANVLIRWHDGGNYPWPGKAASILTSAFGTYSAVVPAEQALFPNSSPNYVRVSSGINVLQTMCCDQASTVQAVSPVARVGPLVAGATAPRDLAINTLPQIQSCGDAAGSVLQGSSSIGLADVSVTLKTQQQTDSSGNYVFQCPAAGSYKIPVGPYTLTAVKSGYYNFASAGNDWYTPTGSVTISLNTSSPVAPVYLWPIGNGNLHITVKRIGSTVPINGATVSITGPSSGSLVTGTAGQAFFNSIRESWPVPGALPVTRYNQTVSNYSVTVTHPAYKVNMQGNVILVNGETSEITILLTPNEGL